MTKLLAPKTPHWVWDVSPDPTSLKSDFNCLWQTGTFECQQKRLPWTRSTFKSNDSGNSIAFVVKPFEKVLLSFLRTFQRENHSFATIECGMRCCFNMDPRQFVHLLKFCQLSSIGQMQQKRTIVISFNIFDFAYFLFKRSTKLNGGEASKIAVITFA